jgi:hypothetical protein
MADDGNSGRGMPFSSFAWPGVFLVLAGAVTYLAYRPALKTPRPPQGSGVPAPASSYDVGAVYARLWEDPLAASYRDPGAEQVRKLAAGRFDKIVADTRVAGQDANLLFLPVLVPGTPYGEDAETRIRTRYAVLAALANCGYNLELNDRMSYVKVDVQTTFKVLDKAPQAASPLTFPTKIYRPRREENVPREHGGVLVCWLNESQLGDRPLDVILQVYHHLFSPEQRERVKVAILGPTGSGALHKMIGEDATLDVRQNTLRFPPDSTMFSPRATVCNDELPWPKGGSANHGTAQFANYGLNLVRCIGTDRELVNSLLKELLYRWPRPPSDGNHRPDLQNHVVLVTERDSLYGRSIRKLFEGAQIGDLFEDAEIRDVFNVGKVTEKFRKAKIPGVIFREFTYLRGADGAVAGADGTASDAAKTRAAARETAGAEPPRGTAQLDYLRRLESHLAGLNEQLRRQGQGEIRAIGVVGTDFYDKLLVLRALRKSFPRAWFFTTDLDAGFYHPEEYDHARNLLVASHFGLSLQSDLQGSVATFRDSYQSATFFAALLALNFPPPAKGVEQGGHKPWGSLDQTDPWGLQGDKPDPGKHLQPLTFEIGRHGAYQLTRTQSCPPAVSAGAVPAGAAAGAGGSVASGPASPEISAVTSAGCTAMAAVHPAGPRDVPLELFSSPRGPLMLLGTLLVLLCLCYFDRHTRQVVAVLGRPLGCGVAWLACGAMAQCLELVAGRPGIAAFRDRCRKDAAGAARVLNRQSLFATAAGLLALAAASFLMWAIWRDHAAVDGEPFSLTEGISVWPSVLIRLLVVVLGAMFLVNSLLRLQANQDDLCPRFEMRREDQPALQQRLAAIQLPPWRRILPLHWEHAVNKPGPPGTPPPAPLTLYLHYCWLGHWGWRLGRVALLTLLYMGFGLCLFFVHGFPNAPTRGELSCGITQAVTFAAVVAMIALMMYVLDATQLARLFVRGLSERARNWTDAQPGIGEHGWTAVADESVGQWRAIDVIGKHTRVISRTFWLPCTLVFLLIVSRLPYFDNWDFPWALLALVLLNLAAAVFCGVVLRLEARKARDGILAHLRMELVAAVGAKGEEAAPQAAQLRRLIAEIESTNVGAFSPLSQDPLLLSLSLPFGGASGLLFLEQLMSWM